MFHERIYLKDSLEKELPMQETWACETHLQKIRSEVKHTASLSGFRVFVDYPEEPTAA